MNAPTTMTGEVIALFEADVAEAGGKARGLARLARAGLRVPDGLVLLAPDDGALPATLREWYAAQGEPVVAVRSSGRDEDGAVTSFAGQYESVLDVRGEAGLVAAIAACVASARSERARAYAAGGGLAVIVQRMVAPRVAGVLFTVDPVLGDAIVVEAVAGVGAALVGGTARPDRWRIDRGGNVTARAHGAAAPLLGDAELAGLVATAMAAEAAFGGPLDLEWAIDEDGEVHWLQARPITGLAGATIDEFDSPVAADAVLTRYNVGEVLPGALTPLTWDVVGGALDEAMRAVFTGLGTFASGSAPRCIVSISGHAFLNMVPNYRFAAGILGSTRDGVDFSIAGRRLPFDVPFAPPSTAVRLRRTLGYVRFLSAAEAALERLAGEVAQLRLRPCEEPAGWLAQLREASARVREALRVHLQVSMRSGSLTDVLQNILTQGRSPEPEHHAAMAALLADVGGVVGAGLVGDLERASLAMERDRLEWFAGADVDEALAWLRGGAAGAAGEAFAELLAAHGHRCVRELELYAADWSEDPRPLVTTMQARARAELAGGTAGRVRGDMPPLPRVTRLLVGGVVGPTRRAIVLRERSKSLAIAVVRAYKRGFAALAEALVRGGRLPEAALVYFCTLAELERLVEAADPALVQRARQRRSVHRRQELLEFPMVCVGVPRPEMPTAGEGDATALTGTPVSRGVVRGPARVARTLAEAAALRPGEILITPHTDIGWTPYFSVAAGLATEIGGTLSHGAVVAREYGLPAVVDLRGATRMFRSGEPVVLDADRGTLRRG